MSEENFGLEEQHPEDDTPDATETGFVELSEEDYQALTLAEQRKYRYNLEQFKKDLKRENARDRKAAQRRRMKQGIPPGTEAKLKEEWRKQRDDIQSNPERIAEFAELKERLAEFRVVEDQTAAAIKRMRDGIHPEAMPQEGRFYEFIAMDYIALAKRYGIGPVLPTAIIPISIDVKHHTKRTEALQKLKEDPEMRFQMRYGLELDKVCESRYFEFFAEFFNWYLNHRQDSEFDYDWTDSDDLAKSFQIPERLLTEPFGEDPGRRGGPKTAWGRLFNFQRQLAPTPYRGSTAGEILAHDDRVLKTLKDLGY